MTTIWLPQYTHTNVVHSIWLYYDYQNTHVLKEMTTIWLTQHTFQFKIN
jgi:hypothetical protein